MDLFGQLSCFYKAIDWDARIGYTHVALYTALLYQSAKKREDPFPIYRSELVRQAKICRKTYNKCMNELAAYGYIQYAPSADPAKPSTVSVKSL